VSPLSLALFDILLLVSIVGLAWAALMSPNDRRSVILFMAFGLVVALAWGRLLAPDVALAEAAIGAGLSGALLLAALRELPSAVPSNGDGRRSHALSNRATRGTVSVLCVALAGMLAWILTAHFEGPERDELARAVAAHLELSGVSNPVTAVLLNFRGYDTLLELAVLLTAVLGILTLGPGRAGYRAAGPIFAALARWLTPLLLVTAGYLLWVGAHAPGGAFQAGATLAAAGIVLRLSGREWIGLPRDGAGLRLVLVAGVGVFLVVGVSLLVLGRPFLGYPPAWAGALILLIESAAMLAIAATLVLAFIGGRLSAEADTKGAAVATRPAHGADPGTMIAPAAGAGVNPDRPRDEEPHRC
jgi:multisubunit Na+/H+ antiporter MnhB subunit